MSDGAEASAAVPSAAQLAAFDARSGRRPVALLYQFTAAPSASRADLTAALARAAVAHGGRLAWAGAGEEIFIGAPPAGDAIALLEFDRRPSARRFVLSADHAAAMAGARQLTVSAMSQQPRGFVLAMSLLARIAPHLPLDPRTEEDAEPTHSTLPAPAQLAALRAHPKPDQPVVFVNWLKFRAQAQYEPPRAACSGERAYQRYGWHALLAVSSIGGRMLRHGRYQQVLVGAAGSPQAGRWDEFAFLQYPGRATFLRMVTLRRYRAALAHRYAGLAEHGQGLMIARPDPPFLWRRRD